MNAFFRATRKTPSCSNERMELSDEALAQQVVGLDDPQAFEVLVQRHQPKILMLQKRLCRDPALAEDLCQETFLHAWRKLATFDNRGSFAGWLAKLAHNIFLQSLRKNKKHRDHEVSEEQAGESAAAAPQSGESAGNQLDLERLLAVVSNEEQVLLVLHYAHGLSASEIAKVVDSPDGTVKSQIHRAKQKIREHFELSPEVRQNQANGVTP